MVAVAHVEEGGRRERVGPSPLRHLDLLIARDRRACLAENRGGLAPWQEIHFPFLVVVVTEMELAVLGRLP